MNDDQKVDQLKIKFTKTLDTLIAKNDNEDKTITISMLGKECHSCFYLDLYLSVIFRTISGTASSVSPLLLKKLTDFVSDAEGLSHSSRGRGIGYAFDCVLLIFF